jgi:acetyl-CoA C-acetyltransferase
MPKSQVPFQRSTEIFDTTLGWRFKNPKLSEMHHPYSMGETAENVARQWKITREEQDIFALASQRKYFEAQAEGKWQSEIVPVLVPGKDNEQIFEADEHPRQTSLEKLASIKPAFAADGTVTAGNSSGINDGAAAMLLADEEAIKKFNLQPIARIVSMATAGVDPAIMGIGPVPATRKAIKRAGIKIEDLSLVELNEAFASQSIACIRDLELDINKVNVNGGAIAIGHPLGCSGVRIATTLLHELQRRNEKYGLATMCVGVGQGASVVFERI